MRAPSPMRASPLANVTVVNNTVNLDDTLPGAHALGDASSQTVRTRQMAPRLYVQSPGRQPPAPLRPQHGQLLLSTYQREALLRQSAAQTPSAARSSGDAVLALLDAMAEQIAAVMRERLDWHAQRRLGECMGELLECRRLAEALPAGGDSPGHAKALEDAPAEQAVVAVPEEKLQQPEPQVPQVDACTQTQSPVPTTLSRGDDTCGGASGTTATPKQRPMLVPRLSSKAPPRASSHPPAKSSGAVVENDSEEAPLCEHAASIVADEPPPRRSPAPQEAPLCDHAAPLFADDPPPRRSPAPQEAPFCDHAAPLFADDPPPRRSPAPQDSPCQMADWCVVTSELKSWMETMDHRFAAFLDRVDSQMHAHLGEFHDKLLGCRDAGNSSGGEDHHSRAGEHGRPTSMMGVTTTVFSSTDGFNGQDLTELKRLMEDLREQTKLGGGLGREAWHQVESEEEVRCQSSDESTGALQRPPSLTSMSAKIGHRGKRLLRRMKTRAESHTFEVFAPLPDNACLALLSRNKWFERISVLMTLLNCVVVAIDAEFHSSEAFADAFGEGRPDHSTWWIVSAAFQTVFVAWLMAEVLVKMVAQRINFLFGKDWLWNIFDLVLALASLASAFLSAPASLTHLRLLRLIRTVRALAVLRFVYLFQGLQRILRAGAAIAVSVCWSMVILVVPIYLGSIAMVEGVTTFLNEEGGGLLDATWGATAGVGSSGRLVALRSYYGGCGRTASTLFRAVTGADWSPFAEAIAATNPVWTWVWVGYISFTLFGVLNILTGVVVDLLRQPTMSAEAVRLATEQQETLAITKLFVSELLAHSKELEPMVSQKKFDHIVRKKRVHDKLKDDFGIDIGALGSVFHLIDMERTDRVSPQRVARRLLTLRGAARSQDVTRLYREVERLKLEVAMACDTIQDVHTMLRRDKATAAHSGSL